MKSRYSNEKPRRGRGNHPPAFSLRRARRDRRATRTARRAPDTGPHGNARARTPPAPGGSGDAPASGRRQGENRAGRAARISPPRTAPDPRQRGGAETRREEHGRGGAGSRGARPMWWYTIEPQTEGTSAGRRIGGTPCPTRKETHSHHKCAPRQPGEKMTRQQGRGNAGERPYSARGSNQNRRKGCHETVRPISGRGAFSVAKTFFPGRQLPALHFPYMFVRADSHFGNLYLPKMGIFKLTVL